MYSAYQLENHHIIDMKWFMSLQSINTNETREETMINIHTIGIPKKSLQLFINFWPNDYTIVLNK